MHPEVVKKAQNTEQDSASLNLNIIHAAGKINNSISAKTEKRI